MPTPVQRPSLTTTLDQRYATQRAGGAFDVKQVLGSPGTTPAAGTTIDAVSMQATNFQTPVGFEVKKMIGVTQMLDAIDTNTSPSAQSKQLSLYIRGFSNQRYKP